MNWYSNICPLPKVYYMVEDQKLKKGKCELIYSSISVS